MATPCYDNRDCSGDMICCETLSGKICLRKQISNQPNYYSRSRCQDGSISSQSCDPGICPPNYKCENGKCCWNNEYAASPSQSQRYTTCRDGRLPSSMCQYGACPPGYTCENGKCCENTDYYTTSSPTTAVVKSGRCPPYLSVIGATTIDRCSMDGDCEESQKCCNTSLGKRCMFPEM
ncbi:hypothetical protein T08_9102 [Trichinella sp. T8]|nr:hypothetical protein T08_9102 [Trichinella sp. T8]